MFHIPPDFRDEALLLNQLLEYVLTDEFIELPQRERKIYLNRLTELIKKERIQEQEGV